MPNPHEIAEEIKLFLSEGQQRSRQELMELARAYAGLCRQANERLRQVADYLRRGLRTEAIYHAEIRPDLLDLITALDFPAVRDWQALSEQHDLERAPDLLLSIAEQLNQAYGAHEKVKEVAGQVRLLALGPAPVRERLAAMRKLVALDPSQDLIADDLGEFESARLREIEKEAAQLEQEKAREGLEELAAELGHPAWRDKRAGALRSEVSAMAAGVRQGQTYEQLEGMLAAIHEAEDAEDYDECRALLARWDEILAENGVGPSAALQERIATAAALVQSWDERMEKDGAFRDAAARLANALEREEIDLVELRDIFHEAQEFRRALGDDLEHRYHVKVGQIEHARRVKGIKRGLLVAGVVALAGAGVAFLIYRGLRNEKIDNWHEQIAAALSQEDWNRAEKLWQDLEEQAPKLARVPKLQARKHELDQAVMAEEARAAQFKTHMGAVIEAGADQPNRGALEAAKEIERTAEEQMQVIEWENKIAAADQRRQDAIDGVFNDKLVELEGKFGEFEREQVARIEEDVDAFEAALAGLQAGFFELDRMKGVSDMAREGLKPLSARLKRGRDLAKRVRDDQRRRGEEEREQRRKEEALARDLNELTGQTGTAAQLAEALNRFAKAHPEEARSAGFARAAKQAKAWEGVLAWDALTDGWTGDEPLAPDDPCARIAEVEGYLGEYGSGCLSGAGRDYLGFLRKAEKAAASSPWSSELPGILMQSTVMRLFSFTTRDGKTYYMLSADKIKANSMGTALVARVVLSPDTDEEVVRRFDGMKMEDLLVGPGPSSQARMVKGLLEQLASFQTEQWDTFGFEVAEAIADERAVDPLLRVMLMKMVVEYLQEYGWGAEGELQKIVKVLEGGGMGETAWMDPDDEIANTQRGVAATVLKKVRSLAGIKNGIADRRRELFGRVGFDGRGQGLALRDEGGWTVVGPPGLLQGGGRLWVVGGATDGAGGEKLVAIGALRDGEVVIDPTRTVGLIEGTMVFVCE